MKRKAIKFSGDYPKLHGQTSAELIAVRDIRIDRDTPAELLTYDTTKSDGSRYELKTGKYLQLIFVGNLGIPFCTIRSAGSDGSGIITYSASEKFSISRRNVSDYYDVCYECWSRGLPEPTPDSYDYLSSHRGCPGI